MRDQSFRKRYLTVVKSKFKELEQRCGAKIFSLVLRGEKQIEKLMRPRRRESNEKKAPEQVLEVESVKEAGAKSEEAGGTTYKASGDFGRAQAGAAQQSFGLTANYEEEEQTAYGCLVWPKGTLFNEDKDDKEDTESEYFD
ncbi:hypothetical protein Dda_7018 [Drechslerella dactyloides]|uniref:Uncharacterized protein n=1 Tax=Drechslerella dactyloides TaxID=74499 RepID=A0AAD6IT89_DREDA|nr:hypothetical protein Dda_7018 [Drechslerella dactyloides]